MAGTSLKHFIDGDFIFVFCHKAGHLFQIKMDEICIDTVKFKVECSNPAISIFVKMMDGHFPKLYLHNAERIERVVYSIVDCQKLQNFLKNKGAV